MPRLRSTKWKILRLRVGMASEQYRNPSLELHPSQRRTPSRSSPQLHLADYPIQLEYRYRKLGARECVQYNSTCSNLPIPKQRAQPRSRKNSQNQLIFPISAQASAPLHHPPLMSWGGGKGGEDGCILGDGEKDTTSSLGRCHCCPSHYQGSDVGAPTLHWAFSISFSSSICLPLELSK